MLNFGDCADEIEEEGEGVEDRKNNRFYAEIMVLWRKLKLKCGKQSNSGDEDDLKEKSEKESESDEDDENIKNVLNKIDKVLEKNNKVEEKVADQKILQKVDFVEKKEKDYKNEGYVEEN